MQNKSQQAHVRRGTVATIVALLIVVLLGFAALAIDISWLVGAKHQLQVAVDHCALSTAAFIAAQPMTAPREDVSRLAEQFGHEFMPVNPVERIALIPDNVKTGNAVWKDGKVVGINPNRSSYDAVRVIVTMSDGQTLPALFGPILGRDHYEPAAKAIALLTARAGALLPFTIHIDDWNAQMARGRDQWKGDDLSLPPKRNANGDGIPEIILYPEHCDDDPSCEPCAGNFGALRINRENLGLPGFAGQIEVGVDRQDLLYELEPQIGEYEIALSTLEWDSSEGNTYGFYVGDFLDGAGEAVEVVFLHGDPGMSIGRDMRDALKIRVGDIVGIFIHIDCLEGGANGTYHIIQIRYARLLGFKFSAGGREILIQPAEQEPTLEAELEVRGLGM